LAVTLGAPDGIRAALEQMIFLAVERFDVARPLLAVVALHRLALVVRFDDGELAVLRDADIISPSRLMAKGVGQLEESLPCTCLADGAF